MYTTTISHLFPPKVKDKTIFIVLTIKILDPRKKIAFISK